MTTADRIAELVRVNRGQMTAEEYAAIADTIVAVQPRAMLVFGAGRDSPLWCDLIPRGSTILFVEDDPAWAARCPGPVLTTRYRGTRDEWNTRDPLTTMPCWAQLAGVEWGLILIDGPRGDRPESPGRLGPIALASGYRDTPIIVHDCHREAERGLCERYFTGREYRTVHHLRIFGA